MSEPEPVQSVMRAFAVVKAMNRRPISSLADLHRETRLPKSTLIRLLQTLEYSGFVGRAAGHGNYELRNELLSLVAGYHGSPMIVEASAQPAEALTRAIKWPVAIGVPDGASMVVRYSTIPSSSLSLLHSSIGMRLSLVTRALGKAYLAYRDKAERRALLDLAMREDSEGAKLAANAERIEAELAEIRARGHAIRDPLVRPVSSTIAVPVVRGDVVIASIGFTWFRSTHGPSQAAKLYLPQLQATALEISKRLEEIGPSPRAATDGR